jgi:large subunit ribosomal protein L13
MSTKLANTEVTKARSKEWVVIDARDQVVGRVAVRISRLLMGKTRPDYTPHVETGIGVIVINSAHVRMTGNKPKAKLYKNFSGYPGGLRERTFERVMKEDPTFALTHAVKGMLPKSRLGRSMLTRFLVYAGAEHPHSAQKPKPYALAPIKK